ncbi:MULTISPECIES: dTDP-glucose 4,6-dehydratase [unclassified Endozoicomonas]|uniref:dTDP-glucose 4,6-dehydratase n=1 Tax=unclassified Endozoicomonas TaxID=2644528 RepID=UPI003BB6B046
MTILVTGSAGFIGANFVIDWLSEMDETVISLDKLTYAGNLNNLSEVEEDERHIFVNGDIGNSILIDRLLRINKPRAVVNFAAESHVDRSIHEPEAFLQTNVIGTFRLLESSRRFYSELSEKDKRNFRFLHVSTDEVYGSLDADSPASAETEGFQPNNPYSASKASSDHLVRAYYHTYDLPALTTNCSNNYGPYQFPEKLIPLVIHNAMAHKPLPIYGDGLQIRDWLYVGDHCRAIRMVLDEGSCGEVYNIGGLNEKANIEVVRLLCDILNEMHPVSGNATITSYHDLITFVEDRPGHDRRYAIDASKIVTELGWRPAKTFATSIQKTVEWYLDNQEWVEQVISGDYHQWIERQYA